MLALLRNASPNQLVSRDNRFEAHRCAITQYARAAVERYLSIENVLSGRSWGDSAAESAAAICASECPIRRNSQSNA